MRRMIFALGLTLLTIGLSIAGGLLTITGQPLLEDAYVDAVFPDENFGSSDELKVGRTDYPTTYGLAISFVKFNIQVPTENTTINNAELQMTVLSRGNWQISVCAHRVEETWSQSTVTWNNQPMYDSQSDENCFRELMTLGGMIGAGDTINFNVTEAMQLWVYNPTMFPLYGFALVGYGQTQVSFQANTAELIIDYTTTGDGLPPDDQQNRTVIIDDDDADTTDSDTGDDTDDDFIKDVPLWAWALIAIGIILIFYGIIRKGG